MADSLHYRVNGEVYRFADERNMQRFVMAPALYCGLVRDPVKPIIREVFGEEARDHHRPGPAKREEPEFVDCEIRQHRKTAKGDAENAIAEPHAEAGGGIARLVAAFLGDAHQDHLDQD